MDDKTLRALRGLARNWDMEANHVLNNCNEEDGEAVADTLFKCSNNLYRVLNSKQEQ